ncbi:MAG: two pore domain potassium channel family protein [Zoogloeaceae bacterium]|nr:two pore domain potassium channel family protein [Zoogloeaceae bacterium]
MNPAKQFSRNFYLELGHALAVVWPVLSGLLGTMMILGFVIARIEGWAPLDGIYFAFVTGLTIGYGDLVPTTAVARSAAIIIGVTGILCTGLIAAIAVYALQHALPKRTPP